MSDQVAQSSESGPQMKENVEKPRRPSFIMRLIIFVLTLVLMVSGMVPLRDMLFAGFASAYFVLFAKYVLPCPTKTQSPSLFPNNRLLRRYVAFAGLNSYSHGNGIHPRVLHQGRSSSHERGRTALVPHRLSSLVRNHGGKPVGRRCRCPFG